MLLALALAIACSGPVAPVDDCPAREYWWGYQEINDAGVTVVDIGGCATPERITFLRDSLLFGILEPRPRP